jgi:hypothetical protein
MTSSHMLKFSLWLAQPHETEMFKYIKQREKQAAKLSLAHLQDLHTCFPGSICIYKKLKQETGV